MRPIGEAVEQKILYAMPTKAKKYMASIKTKKHTQFYTYSQNDFPRDNLTMTDPLC
jgi:hypothetical protein